MRYGLVAVGAVALSVWAAEAVPVLVPAPREVKWDGGTCSASAIVDRRDVSLPKEGYRLEIAADGITVTSSDAAGAFYARQTLRQLAEIGEGGASTNYPCCTISDAPAYSWRAVLLDEGRHFQGRETVKNLLDVMAYHKFNVLHWHLTEDQGWRLDVPGMPELVKYGSVRPESPKHGEQLKCLGNFRYESAHNGQQYGPFFYTKADLEEIVAYAKDLQISIVPEIDFPGHFRSALAAHPELACFPEAIQPRMAHCEWGITTNVLCVGNDESVRFMEHIMDFVCDVFPSKVIHIGGDECPHVVWERCPKCQARMKAEGFTRPAQLQGWITRQIAGYLAKKGRRIMGWDEILGAGVPISSIGQIWRNGASEGASTDYMGAADGAARGFDLVVTPHTETYYSRYAGVEDDPFDYASRKSPLTLEKSYLFDPMRGMPESARPHILGSEACIWSEYIWNEYDLAWKLWPRGCDMSEILWTAPKTRDFADFLSRMKTHRKRLIAMGINCQPLQ